ncbi:MAG TPA: TetR/AcrR family transcriptional regulator [Propionibacteriaceae bacterium]
MPRPSQRDAIVSAALRSFAEHGYDATRVKHIADKAGVAESALYRHFPSKEAIAQELYAEFLRRYAEKLLSLANSGEEPEAKLRALIALILDTYRADPDAFVFVLFNTSRRLPRLPAGTVYPLDVIESMIKEAQAAGVVRDGQSNLLAAILLGAVQQPVVLATLGRPGALDLLRDRGYDATITEAALGAVRRMPC